MTSRDEEYPGLSKWVQCNQEWKMHEEELVSTKYNVRKTLPATAGFEDGEGGLWAKECRQSLEAIKS